MNNILIIGHGYVGSAVSSIFNKREKTIIDPRLNNIKISDIRHKKFDIIFVCVDTPRGEKFKTLDNVLRELNENFTRTVVCCKSTASPLFYRAAIKKYCNITLVFNPEFLSHYSNIYDYKNQTFLILGGNKSASKKIARILKPRLRKLVVIRYTDIETAALVKYAENGFLSYKVTFFNELFQVHKKLKLISSYKALVSLLTLDKRIGASHTEVPGRDRMFGWGGHCYNKDNNEFAKFSNSKLLKFLIKINKSHRGLK
jgi:UDPglucose 6-dehydrogenase